MERPERIRPAPNGGFTLLELLVVAGLVAAMSAVVVAGLDGSHGTALAAAQSTLEQFVQAARARAIAAGRPTRVLVHHDPANDAAAARYLRVLALQQLRDEEWSTVEVISLPEGVGVVPHAAHTPAGLLTDEGRWRTPSGARLHSSALFQPTRRARVDTPVEENWACLQFTELGTTATAGQLVVATVRRAPHAGGEQPAISFAVPEQVRGLQLSVYGLATRLDGLEDF